MAVSLDFMSHANKVRPQQPPAAVKEVVAQLNAHIIDKIVPNIPQIEGMGINTRLGLQTLSEIEKKSKADIYSTIEDKEHPAKLATTISSKMLNMATLTLWNITASPSSFTAEFIKTAQQLSETTEVTTAFDKWSPNILDYLSHGPRKIDETLASRIPKEHLIAIKEIVKQGNSGKEREQAAKNLQTALDNVIDTLKPFSENDTQNEKSLNDKRLATTLIAQLNIIKDIVNVSDTLIAEAELAEKKSSQPLGR